MANSEHSIKKTDFDPERQHKAQDKAATRRKLVAERKKFKRNQQPKGPRRKDWTPATRYIAELGEPESDSNVAFERIMPLDERDRRRTLEQAAFGATTLSNTDGELEENDFLAQDQNLIQGMVTAIASALCRVTIGDETLLCTVRGTLHAKETGFTNALAVGDQVLIRKDNAGGAIVEHIFPRRTFLARPDVFYPHLQQLVVANADQLLIVASWRDPIIWFELIDRYLVAAARNHLPAIICINKIDLATLRAECERDLRPYQELGIRCILTSAQSGEGINELRTLLQSRTSVLAGLSGVGKSSLLSAVQPSLRLRVGDVSEHSGEGRHTTTQATLLQLDNQTCVVDTPGIREFGLGGLTRAQLIAYFPEIQEAAHNCRFRNCTHREEPGCAVQHAVGNGVIAQSRIHSYRLIVASLRT